MNVRGRVSAQYLRETIFSLTSSIRRTAGV